MPEGRFKNQDESFPFEGFEIAISNGVFEIGFDNQADTERAREVARQFLAWFGIAHGAQYAANFNQSWEVKPDSTKTVAVSFSETVRGTADVRITVIRKDMTYAVTTFDSAKLSSYSAQVAKSQKDPVLGKTLAYFSEEVIDSKRPLYGVYKALEELAAAVGGRDKLAVLVGQPEKYVSDVMQTTQHARHSSNWLTRTKAARVLSDEECRARAQTLIEAYEKSI